MAKARILLTVAGPGDLIAHATAPTVVLSAEYYVIQFRDYQAIGVMPDDEFDTIGWTCALEH